MTKCIYTPTPLLYPPAELAGILSFFCLPGIITDRCSTNARSWLPIIPRGVPRGHGIFYRSVKGRRSSSPSSFHRWGRFRTPLRGQRRESQSWHSSKFFFAYQRHSEDQTHLEVPGVQTNRGVQFASFARVSMHRINWIHWLMLV